MTIEFADASKWVTRKAPINRAYLAMQQGLIADSAARGFSLCPAVTINAVQHAGYDTKLKLSDALADTHKETTSIEFQVDEFGLRLAVEYSRLEMAVYVQEILNALEYEAAVIQDDYKRGRADIDKIGADINKRNVTLILEEATIKQSITDSKIQIVEAQSSVLGEELKLLEAKVETAEIRLQIIPYLKQVIAAEQLIIEATWRKVAALKILLEVEKEIAAIKESMLPLYTQLAAAKSRLATYIKQEARDKMAIARLQVERARLKLEECNAFAEQKEKEIEREIAETELHNIRLAVEQFRIDMRTILADTRATIESNMIAAKQELKMSDIDINNTIALTRAEVRAQASIDLNQDRAAGIGRELIARLNALSAIASIQEHRILESRYRTTNTYSSRRTTQYISS